MCGGRKTDIMLKTPAPNPFAIIILLFTFLISGTTATAQEVKIRKEKDFSPILNVFVFNIQHTISALSDSNGVLSLDDFSPDDTLVFQHPSFHRFIITKAALAKSSFHVLLKEYIVPISEFVFSISKTEESKKEIPFKIETIDYRDIEFTNAGTTADLLQQRGGVAVQKSQAGGGSPIIRGFEANKILLVVDGVRMNNAIYRSGHLQNAITVDNAALERVEVLFGPGSVIYGSDALGGVVHFFTRDPVLAKTDSNVFNVGAFTRYALPAGKRSSANNEFTSHFDLNLGFKKLGFFSSFTTSKFNDLRMGNRRHPNYPDFGKVAYYAVRTEGADSMVVNSDPDIQRFSGYNQLDFLQKVLYKPSEKLDFTLNLQYSTSSDIPRFDKLNDMKNNQLKYAEWHYGPQKRFFASLKSHIISKSKLLNTGTIILAFQDIEESRITRKFGSAERIKRKENVKAYSINLDFMKKIDAIQKLHYGVEAIRNDVASSAFEENIITEKINSASTRYPDGGSFMHSFAGYLSYKRKLGKKANLHTGVRYSYIQLHSKFSDTAFVQLPFDKVDIRNNSLSGSLGMVYFPFPKWQINTVVSSGFRAPNVDDYGKVFAKNDKVVVPNNLLKPEYAYNGELGITKSFGKEILKINGTFFYTRLIDAIVRTDFQLNGKDSLIYDGDMNKIQANTNASRAYIYGYSATIIAKLSQRISMEHTFNYTYGFDVSDDVPLGHIPPVYGKASVNYASEKFQSSLYTHFNGWKRIELYSPSGVDNENEATPDGTPAWYTLNFSNTFVFSERIKLQLAVENILDQHYKPFASGISAPGRNFIATLRALI